MKTILFALLGITLLTGTRSTATAAAPGPARQSAETVAAPVVKQEHKRLHRMNNVQTPKAEKGAVGKVILILIALFLPPLAVFLKVGIRMPFWLNLLLTLFFFIPGMIHALIVVVR
ncbi:MAG: hypothetical protein OHK0039_17030 [Bacteroidia bacterium]